MSVWDFSDAFLSRDRDFFHFEFIFLIIKSDFYLFMPPFFLPFSRFFVVSTAAFFFAARCAGCYVIGKWEKLRAMKCKRLCLLSWDYLNKFQGKREMNKNSVILLLDLFKLHNELVNCGWKWEVKN